METQYNEGLGSNYSSDSTIKQLKIQTSHEQIKQKEEFAHEERMEQIKNDIINVLQKYLEIDLEGLDIKISQTELDENGAVPALFANIPIKDMKAKEDVSSESSNKKNKNGNNIKRTIVTNGSKDKLKV
jgi:cell division topological specificity factor MinE